MTEKRLLYALIFEQFNLYPGKKLTPGNMVILLKDSGYTEPEIVRTMQAMIENGYLANEVIGGVNHASLKS